MVYFIRILLISLFIPISYSNADINTLIEESLKQLTVSKERLRDLPSSDAPQEINDLSGTDSLFGIKFDPNSSFSFDIDITKPSIITTEIDNPNTPNTKILSTMELKDGRQSYQAYKCSVERSEMLVAVNPALATNLNASIDSILDGVVRMEHDIKSSISNVISGLFESINSYFRPEYVMSKTMEVMINKGAEYTCGTCKTTNKAGCNSIFLYSEVFKSGIQNEVIEMNDDSVTMETTKLQSEGPIIEWSAGSTCPTNSLLTMPSGIGFFKKYAKLSSDKDMDKTEVEAVMDQIDGDAMQQCLKTEKERIKRFFEDVLNTAAGSIVYDVEAQNKCLDENSNPITQFSKSEKVTNEIIADYFNDLNDYINNDINKKSQKFTGSIISQINNKIGIINTGVLPQSTIKLTDKTKKVVEAIMEPHKGTLPNASIYDILDYSLEQISKQSSTSMSKRIAYDMAQQLVFALHLKSKLMQEFVIKYKNGITINLDKSFDFVSNKNILFDTLTEYEDALFQEMSFPPSRSAPYFSCSQFDPDPALTQSQDFDKCFHERKIQRFTLNYDPTTTTCTCTDFGKLIDIISNPISKKNDLLSELKEPTGTPETWQQQYDIIVYEIKNKYLNSLSDSLIAIQSKSDDYLSKMHIMEQEEVKRLFRMILNNFKL